MGLSLSERQALKFSFPGIPHTLGLLWPNELEFYFDWYKRKSFSMETQWEMGGECELGGVAVFDENGLVVQQWDTGIPKLYPGDQIYLQIEITLNSAEAQRIRRNLIP